MLPTSWLEINLSHLDANLAHFRALVAAGASPPTPPASQSVPSELVSAGAIPPRRSAPADAAPATGGGPRRPTICGVVKADAYGLGAAMIAQRLANRGIDMLAVFSPAQAEQLGALTLHCPTLILMRMGELGRGDPLYRHAATGRLHLSIHDRPQLQELEHRGRMLGVKLPIHLYVDTGMSRAGLSLDELPAALTELHGLRHLTLSGIYTHLASSESDAGFTDVQVGRLDHVLNTHRGLLPPGQELIIHVANTCAALRDARLHRDMIRVGLGLYGYGPEQMKTPVGSAGATARESRPTSGGLQPLVRWISRVLHVQRYAKGSPVGYGSTQRLERDSVLGVVPVGYADGYPLLLSSSATVGVMDVAPAAAQTGGSGTATPAGRTRGARVLGRVNMDQIVIDMTDAAATLGAGNGALVELVSDDPASSWGLPNLAAQAKSSCYEMLCRLSARVPRRYVTEV